MALEDRTDNAVGSLSWSSTPGPDALALGCLVAAAAAVVRRSGELIRAWSLPHPLRDQGFRASSAAILLHVRIRYVALLTPRDVRLPRIRQR